MQVDVPKLKKSSGVAVAIATSSVALPFCLGAFWRVPGRSLHCAAPQAHRCAALRCAGLPLKRRV